jgi:hypothetical protein
MFLMQVEGVRTASNILRPGSPALLDGENLDLAVALRDNVACCFTDQSPRDGET